MAITATPAARASQQGSRGAASASAGWTTARTPSSQPAPARSRGRSSTPAQKPSPFQFGAYRPEGEHRAASPPSRTTKAPLRATVESGKAKTSPLRGRARRVVWAGSHASSLARSPNGPATSACGVTISVGRRQCFFLGDGLPGLRRAVIGERRHDPDGPRTRRRGRRCSTPIGKRRHQHAARFTAAQHASHATGVGSTAAGRRVNSVIIWRDPARQGLGDHGRRRGISRAARGRPLRRRQTASPASASPPCQRAAFKDTLRLQPSRDQRRRLGAQSRSSCACRVAAT